MRPVVMLGAMLLLIGTAGTWWVVSANRDRVAFNGRLVEYLQRHPEQCLRTAAGGKAIWLELCRR